MGQRPGGQCLHTYTEGLFPVCPSWLSRDTQPPCLGHLPRLCPHTPHTPHTPHSLHTLFLQHLPQESKQPNPLQAFIQSPPWGGLQTTVLGSAPPSPAAQPCGWHRLSFSPTH